METGASLECAGHQETISKEEKGGWLLKNYTQYLLLASTNMGTSKHLCMHMYCVHAMASMWKSKKSHKSVKVGSLFPVIHVGPENQTQHHHMEPRCQTQVVSCLVAPLPDER